MGAEAYQNSCYDGAVSFFKALAQTMRQNKINIISDSIKGTTHNVRYVHVKSLLNTFIRVHDTTLADKGQFGVTHSCRSHPYTKTIGKKSRVRKEHNILRILDRETLLSHQIDPEGQISYRQKNVAVQDQAKRLCYGQQLKVSKLYLEFHRVYVLSKLFASDRADCNISAMYLFLESIRKESSKLFLHVFKLIMVEIGTYEN